MKIIYYTIIFFLCSSISIFSQNKFALGVNLDNDGAFVNIINQTNRYSKVVSFDSTGWPQSDFDLVLLDGRPATEWNGTIDDPEKYRVNYSGRYNSSFIGLAKVTATGTSVTIENIFYDTLINTTYFDVVIGGYPDVNHGLVFLSFTNTRRTLEDTLNSGITYLKVNRPGYDINTSKIFTEEYISLCKSADFACFRYYVVQNIWDGEPAFPQTTTWYNRKKPDDASQSSMASMNGKKDGWCWEYIIELSNILNKDIWINIHISCDSLYVNKLAKLLQHHLNSSIKIYVENSNEVWSPTQATHGPYNKAQADFYKISFDQNYARRTIELSNWFANVFGKNDINKRIRVILAGQEAYSGRSDTHLNYIKNNIGEPKDYIYALSSALYFSSTNSSSTDTTLIYDGMIEDINSQISNQQNSNYRLNHINKANNWGLIGGCTSYEGGPGLPSGGSTNNLANQILANRTSKMKDVIKLNYLEGWKNLDGGLALYFTLVSDNRYGCWGITDDYTNPDRNYKMTAIREIISQTTGNNDLQKEQTRMSILLFPNPSSDFISISGYYGKLMIFDFLGKEVWKGIIKEKTNIEVRNWQKGVYIIIGSNQKQLFIKY